MSNLGKSKMTFLPSNSTTCPFCGARFMLHTSADGSRQAMNNGDFSICNNCKNVSTYSIKDGIYSLVPMMAADWENLEKEEPEAYQMLKGYLQPAEIERLTQLVKEQEHNFNTSNVKVIDGREHTKN